MLESVCSLAFSSFPLPSLAPLDNLIRAHPTPAKRNLLCYLKLCQVGRGFQKDDSSGPVSCQSVRILTLKGQKTRYQLVIDKPTDTYNKPNEKISPGPGIQAGGQAVHTPQVLGTGVWEGKKDVLGRLLMGAGPRGPSKANRRSLLTIGHFKNCTKTG